MSWVQGNHKRFWDTVLAEVREDDTAVDQDIDRWENNLPTHHDLSRFFQAYAFVVYNTGFSVKVLEKLEPRIEAALRHHDVKAIARDREGVLRDLLAVNSHPGKAQWVVDAACKLANRDLWTGWIRGMKRSEAEVKLPQEFKGLGSGNVYHLMRNLGWDVPTHGGFTRNLATAIGTDCETLMAYLSRASGLRISTTDTVVGLWSRLPQHADDEECIDRFCALIGLE